MKMFNYRNKYQKLLKETKDERLSLRLTLNQLQAQINMLSDKVKRKNIQINILKREKNGNNNQMDSKKETP